MKKSHIRIFLCLLILGAAACQPVKPYQRIYLEDHEMKLGKRSVMMFEESMETYREGASGGGSGKGSGGCGCN